MTSYIIECKNKLPEGENPDLQQPAGQFTTNIQDKVWLEDGDSIVMKQVYIDTNQTVSQNVTVRPEGETLTFKFIHYQNNFDLMPGYRQGMTQTQTIYNGLYGDWGLNSTYNQQQWGHVGAPGEVGGIGDNAYSSGGIYTDGNLYLKCNLQDSSGGDDYKMGGTNQEVKLVPDDATKPWGGFVIQFQYQHIEAVPPGSGNFQAAFYYHTIPSLAAGTTSYIIKTPFIFRQAVNDGSSYAFGDPDTSNVNLIQDVNYQGTNYFAAPVVYKNSKLSVPAPSAWNQPPAYYVYPTGTHWSKNLGPLYSDLNVFEPIEYTTSFFIPGGNYPPNDLAELITRELAGIQNDGTGAITNSNISKNNLLVPVPVNSRDTWVTPDDTREHWNDDSKFPFPNALDFRYRYGDVGGGDKSGSGTGREAYDNSNDGVDGTWNTAGIFKDSQNRFEYPGSNRFKTALYSGTNQIELKFEPDTSNFYWNYTHMPYYSGGVESVGYQWCYVCPTWGVGGASSGGRERRLLKTVDATGGIIFTSLTSKAGRATESGEITRFFEDTLGFQTDPTNPFCITMPYTLITNKHEFQTGSSPKPPFFSAGDRNLVIKPTFVKTASAPDGKPVVGTHITAGFMGVSSATDITVNIGYGSTTYLKPPDVPEYVSEKPYGGGNYPVPLGNKFFDTGGATVPIYSNQGVLARNNSLAYGYFLVEVESNFQNNYITTDQNRHSMMGIVSRYYEREAFTSGGEDGSLVYTHRGAPALLSSFNIRILDSDKNLADNLGVDNTVFLEIAKAPKNEIYPPGKNPFIEKKQ